MLEEAKVERSVGKDEARADVAYSERPVSRESTWTSESVVRPAYGVSLSTRGDRSTQRRRRTRGAEEAVQRLRRGRRVASMGERPSSTPSLPLIASQVATTALRAVQFEREWRGASAREGGGERGDSLDHHPACRELEKVAAGQRSWGGNSGEVGGTARVRATYWRRKMGTAAGRKNAVELSDASLGVESEEDEERGQLCESESKSTTANPRRAGSRICESAL